MKKILFGLLSILMLSSCQQSREVKYLGLKGEIQSIKDTQHEAIDKFGEVIPQDIMGVTKITFNLQGQPTSYASYNGDGEELFIATNEFKDGKCSLIKQRQQYNNITTIQKPISVKSSNEKWELEKSTGEKRIIQIEYVDSIKNTTHYDIDNKLIETIFEVYDSKQNLLEAKITNVNNEVMYWTKSTFDENNYETMKTIINEYGEDIYMYTYPKFDNNGNWLVKNEYFDGNISTTIRKITYQ